MTAPSITEFIEARLAEVTMAAAGIHDLDCDLARNGPVDPRWGWECDCGHPARVLAQVAALRATLDFIFDMAAKIDGEWGCCHIAEALRAGAVVIDLDEDPVPLPDYCMGSRIALQGQQPIAAIWADHADYDQEWKP